MKNLSDILPLYGAEHDMLISKRGDLTIAYELQLPEIFTLSNNDYESIHQCWIKAIKQLPVGTYLHKQDWFLEMQYVPDFDRGHSFLSHSSDRHFLDRLYLSHQCRLMLTLPARDAKPVSSLYSSLLRKHLVPVETIDPAFAKSFEETCSQFVRVLSDTGQIACKRINNEELVNIVNEYLALGTDGIRRDLDFSNGVTAGEKHTVMFSMANAESLPVYCGPRITHDPYSTDTVKFPVGFVSPICQLLPCNHIYQQFIRIENTAAALRKLEKKKLRLQSLSAYSRENRVARDAADSFLQEAALEARQVVSAHFHVLAWANDAAKLQELRNACAAGFTAIDASAKVETLGAPQLYWAGIPGNAADLPENETFLTFAGQASCLINTETGYRSSDGSFGIRLGDRISGQPLLVDLSDEPMKRGVITNRNKFVLGPSGSGKSFFTNHMMRAYYESGAHIFIIDVGHSYKGLCEMVGGYYFTYTEQKPISFNPFYLAPGESIDTEKKESIKALLLAAAKNEDEIFTRSEYVGLSNAIQLYYETKIAFRCFDSFYAFLQNEFSDVLKKNSVRDKDFDVAHFLYVLRPFYKGGEFDYLLNARENLNLMDQRLIIFELDNIKDHPVLFPIVTIIIMESFISKVRKLKGIRKVMEVEEAWKNLMKAGMSEFILLLVKTLRKYFGELVIVTQEIEDIISSPVVKQAIINNSDCKILLDQSKYENRFELVQELLGLTDKEKALVLSLNRANDPNRKYKEVFISLGGRISKVYRVEVSPEEYLTYTTEEREKIMVTNAAEKCGSIEAGIKSIVQQQNSEV
jgi:conjugation system TraG family ATPase